MDRGLTKRGYAPAQDAVVVLGCHSWSRRWRPWTSPKGSPMPWRWQLEALLLQSQPWAPPA